jgi:hypothetical protein
MNALTFTSNGEIVCLYTEAIDLTTLGILTMTRATQIEFNVQTQQWEVRDTAGSVLHTDHRRSACLNWEQEYFNQ